MLSTTAEASPSRLRRQRRRSFNSPIKGAVKWLAGKIEGVIEPLFGEGNVFASPCCIVGIALIFMTLTLITKNMRLLVARRIETSLNAALARVGPHRYGLGHRS